MKDKIVHTCVSVTVFLIGVLCCTSSLLECWRRFVTLEGECFPVGHWFRNGRRGTLATLTLNSFADNGGGASSCTGTFFDDDVKVVALSTGWFDGGSWCGKSVVIRASNGRSVTATVVDECDSLHGCDDERNFEPPCANDIVDGSPAVWKALRLDTDDGKVPFTWWEA